MKRKILAIALSLALLSSLFVFAAPVSAGVGGGAENASDNSPLFDFEIKFAKASDAPLAQYDYWRGPEIEVEGKTLLGTIRLHGNTTYTFPITDSFWGEGDMYIYMEIHDNFQSGKRVCDWTFTFTFDGHTGSFVMECQRILWFNGWRNTDPNSYKAFWIGGHAHFTVSEGTGDFENFHASIDLFGDEITQGGGKLTGAGHFAP